MDRSYLEDNGVDVEKGLELLGDMNMYNETMEDFLNEINEKYPQAKEYELKSKENDEDFVNNNFSTLENEINRIINVVKTYLGKE